MKLCTKCKEEKPDECFRWQNKAKGVRQRWCKSCASAHESSSWKNNDKFRTKRFAEQAIRLKRNQKFLDEYMSDKSCEICGINDPRVLEFDHLDRATKKDNVSDLIHKICSITTILDEISKCRILCANCHRIYTREQRNYYR